VSLGCLPADTGYGWIRMSKLFDVGTRLDLSGVPCPHNSSRAIVELEVMDEGEILEIIIDDGEPSVNVPVTLEQEMHQILDTRRYGDQWLLLVRRGPDL
jgi:tRNA 2-thiouridine synthesizing protein A